MTYYLENKAKGRRYQILALDKTQEPPLLTLQGEHGPFTQAFDKAHFAAIGYELVKDDAKEDQSDG
jgi:hypothetical protein